MHEKHVDQLFSSSEVITMLNRTTKSNAGPRSKNRKATQNKNNTKTTALERPVA